MQLLVRLTAFCVASIKCLSQRGIVARALFFWLKEMVLLDIYRKSPTWLFGRVSAGMEQIPYSSIKR